MAGQEQKTRTEREREARLRVESDGGHKKRILTGFEAAKASTFHLGVARAGRNNTQGQHFRLSLGPVNSETAKACAQEHT